MRFCRMLVVVFLAVFLFSTSIFAYSYGNELALVPNSRPEDKGFLEVGGGLLGGYQKTANTFATVGNVFLRFGVASFAEYGVTNEYNKILHNFQIMSDPYSPTRSSYVSLGYKNVGWTQGNTAQTYRDGVVMGGYLSTSFQMYEYGTWIHTGIAENRSNSRAVGFVGLEYQTLLGILSVEWDSEFYSLGVKQQYSGGVQFTLSGLFRMSNELAALQSQYIIRAGISLVDSPRVKREEVKVASENAAAKKREKSERLASESAKVKERVVTRSVFTHVSPTRNAMMMTTANAAAIRQNKTPTANGDELVRRSMQLLQRGNYYYYQGMYQDALTEYLDLIKLNPTNAAGFVAIGSIYFQMNMIEDAKRYWREALRLDPDQIQLRAFLRDHNVDIGPLLREEAPGSITPPIPGPLGR